jgi:hypothetical protein
LFSLQVLKLKMKAENSGNGLHLPENGDFSASTRHTTKQKQSYTPMEATRLM